MLPRDLLTPQLCRTCLKYNRQRLPITTSQQQLRYFHPSRRKFQSQDTFPDHYQTLHLPSTASAVEIKKSFYTLSKQYHPDVNHDPAASDKFVKISEAYHVLGSSEKKGRYDRDYHRVRGHSARGPGGSHSSAGGRGPAGGRPASGLSKRRSQFRGPPPSFYAQGGFGTQSARQRRAQDADARREQDAQASRGDTYHPGGLGSQPNFTGTGGFSPGSDDRSYYGADADMPYFDRASHQRTHDNLGARRERIYGDAHQSQSTRQAADDTVGGGGLIANFLIVSTVVAAATVLGNVLVSMVTNTNGTASSRSGREKIKENG